MPRSNDQTWSDAAGPDRVQPGYGRTLGLLVRGKNINPQTLLATDYLNHFNEIVMLLEILPAMPECLDDAREWRPKSYQEHFNDSAFSDKELAILAYDNCPDCYRRPFERTVARMNAAVAQGMAEIEAAVAGGDSERLQAVAGRLTGELHGLIAKANGIVQGTYDVADQAAVDRIMAP